MTPADLEQLIGRMISLGPARTFEDVPISLCLFPFLVPENGSLVVRGTTQRREGHRWGMSASWNRKTPHYMLPASILHRQPPRRPMHVTGCQVIDFIYDPVEMAEKLARDSWVKRSFKEMIGIGPLPADPELKSQQVMGIVREQPFAKGAWLERFHLLSQIQRPSQMHTIGVYDCAKGIDLIGFAMLWIESKTCFVVHRYLLPTHRRHTRSVDFKIALAATKLGCTELNLGDAHRLPGVFAYKLELQPLRLGHYINILDHEEAFDHEQPRIGA